jgi:2,3-bisphosphoglycerate-independent phosphoglycerate mutase
MKKPVVLIVLDGWGLAPPGPGNAISQAKLTHIPHYWNTFPHTRLAASGEAVGLPDGEDGNTETGHINIGAGRVVYQDLPRINMSIADGSFFTNEAFLSALHYAQNHNTNLHIMGLLSDSGVHASRQHLFGLLTFLQHQGAAKGVYLHLFTDGRDAPPTSALRFIDEIEEKCRSTGVGKIATIMGRYYGMDRDKRWDRTQKAYEALTEFIPRAASSAKDAIAQAYRESLTDEFIPPTVILDTDGKPLPRIQNYDSVIFYNYRIDRPRQLTNAFILPNFESQPSPPSFDPYATKYFSKHVVEEIIKAPFTRHLVLPNLFFVTMTEYERGIPASVAFPPQPVHLPLGRVLSEAGERQLRMSETEKERFVTYYFNGMREDPYAGEDHIIVPSPKVPIYDLKPEMSSMELTERLLDRLTIDVYSFILINFACPDMVAHTGNIAAAIKSCEAADTCVGSIVSHTLAKGGTCIITADHGNVEEMLGPNGEMDTEHSTFPVPFIMIDSTFEGFPNVLPAGKLADIAPTILAWMHIPVPSEMTGQNLLVDFKPKGGR